MRENLLVYDGGGNLKKNSDRLTYRPVVGGEEVQKTTTIWRAEAITKMVTLTAISLDMFIGASKEGRTVLVRLPHVLELFKFFTDW